MALERAFTLFYNSGLTLAFFSRNHQLFGGSEEIREELAHAYADLLVLVTDVTVFFRKRSNGMWYSCVPNKADKTL